MSRKSTGSQAVHHRRECRQDAAKSTSLPGDPPRSRSPQSHAARSALQHTNSRKHRYRSCPPKLRKIVFVRSSANFRKVWRFLVHRRLKRQVHLRFTYFRLRPTQFASTPYCVTCRCSKLPHNAVKVNGKNDACVALSKNPITKLRSVTCRMGSHSVTCHSTQVNAFRLNPSQTRFNYSEEIKKTALTMVGNISKWFTPLQTVANKTSLVYSNLTLWIVKRHLNKNFVHCTKWSTPI